MARWCMVGTLPDKSINKFSGGFLESRIISYKIELFSELTSFITFRKIERGVRHIEMVNICRLYKVIFFGKTLQFKLSCGEF